MTPERIDRRQAWRVARCVEGGQPWRSREAPNGVGEDSPMPHTCLAEGHHSPKPVAAVDGEKPYLGLQILDCADQTSSGRATDHPPEAEA